jgi:hypothetical protein
MVPAAFSVGVKRHEREADHCPSSGVLPHKLSCSGDWLIKHTGYLAVTLPISWILQWWTRKQEEQLLQCLKRNIVQNVRGYPQ